MLSLTAGAAYIVWCVAGVAGVAGGYSLKDTRTEWCVTGGHSLKDTHRHEL